MPQARNKVNEIIACDKVNETLHYFNIFLSIKSNVLQK